MSQIFYINLHLIAYLYRIYYYFALKLLRRSGKLIKRNRKEYSLHFLFLAFIETEISERIKLTGVMKILLEIPENKAASFMEVLKSISFVKAKIISDEKALLMEEIKEAVGELKLIKEGKLKGIPAKELLDEL